MSRGELIVDDNQIKPSDDWASEYQQQYNANPDSWADQFVREEASFIIIINIDNTIIIVVVVTRDVSRFKSLKDK